MKYLMILLAVGILAGCSNTTYLKHPNTGETVKCGPYSTTDLSGEGAIMEMHCIDDFQRMCYVRQSD